MHLPLFARLVRTASWLLVVAVFLCFSACQDNSTNEDPAEAAFRNPELPVAERVADLLRYMSVEEKVAQITALWQEKYEMQDEEGNFMPELADSFLRHQHGLDR